MGAASGRGERPDGGAATAGPVQSSKRWTSWTRRSCTWDIDVTTYGRQRDKLREELTFAKIDHHAEAVDELDVEGILAFAERILPRASDMWVQASLDYKQRLQLLFFPEGIPYDGNRFESNRCNGTTFQLLGAVFRAC